MKKYIKNLERPEIWAVLAALFVFTGLFLSSYGRFPGVKNTSEILIVTFAGIAAYLLGVKFHRGVKHLGFVPIPIAFFMSTVFIGDLLKTGFIVSAIFSALPLLGYIWVERKEKSNPERLYILVFLSGLSLFIVSIFINGVPLLSPDIHFESFETLFPAVLPSFYLMVYPAVKTRQRRDLFFLVLSICLLLSTLRFYIFVALFAWVLVSLEGSKEIETKKIYILLGVIVVSTVLMEGYLYGAGTGAGYIESAARRPAFTLSVLDRIVESSFPLGGEISCFVSDCGRQVCRELFSYDCRLTSTSFGFILYSFGLPGVLVCFSFFGAVLANLKKEDYPIYCILLPYLITSIERGFTAGEVVVFIYLGYSVIWWRNR